MFPFVKWRIVIIVLLIASGCKKDLLHFKQALRLETYSTDDRLNKIYFTDSRNGYIVGGVRFDRGVILTTHDGGITWQRSIIPAVDKEILGIASSPEGKVFAISFDGRFISSEDTGATWQVRQVGYEPYKDIIFPAANHCILAGGISFNMGYIVHMDSVGNTLRREEPHYELNDMEMRTASALYACGHGVVQKSADSGYTWRVLDIHNDNFTAVHAYDNMVWVCGYNGGMFVSYNGGDSWERKRNGNDITLPRYRLLDFVFIDDAHGYAVGEDGLIIYTDDGGNHWSEFDRFTDKALRSIIAMKDGRLLVCGDDGSLYQIKP